MKRSLPLAAISLAMLLLAPQRVLADDGHDHGDAAPTTAGPALPRFAAASDLFELVGVLNGQQLTLYLDRFADNAPVRAAQIELDIGGQKFNATNNGEDVYAVLLKEPPKPGVLPITATVTAGSEVDLLAGELDLHEEAHADEPGTARSWLAVAGWAAAGLALLGLLAWGTHRLVAGRQGRTEGVTGGAA